jgi:acetyl esterase/lipase
MLLQNGFQITVTLNLDSSRLVIAGDSVGGNMATAVALLAKERWACYNLPITLTLLLMQILTLPNIWHIKKVTFLPVRQ